MSGGLYGGGKAPERHCLRPDRWPEEDRKAWFAACALASSPLEEDWGARANHASISNRKTERGYGRWLTHLQLNDSKALEMRAAERISSPRVIAYVECMAKLGNRSQTILTRLQELGEMAKVMSPAHNWFFINKIASKVRYNAGASRAKSHLRLGNELVGLGFDMMSRADEIPFGIDAAVMYRDGLLISLLALVPLRRRNLAELRLGSSFIRRGGEFLITFGPHDMKGRAPFEILVPSMLQQFVETYLAKWRPLLVARKGRWFNEANHRLWISKDGSPLTQMSIYDRIRRHTKDAFGRPMNPHLFRDAAATTMAIADPANVRLAAPLLAHRTFATTERYYQQATAMQAQRAFAELVEELKGRGGEGSPDPDLATWYEAVASREIGSIEGKVSSTLSSEIGDSRARKQKFRIITGRKRTASRLCGFAGRRSGQRRQLQGRRRSEGRGWRGHLRS